MSKIKNGGLDQYGAEPFEQQQFGTSGVEGVNTQTDTHTVTRSTWPACKLMIGLYFTAGYAYSEIQDIVTFIFQSSFHFAFKQTKSSKTRDESLFWATTR